MEQWSTFEKQLTKTDMAFGRVVGRCILLEGHHHECSRECATSRESNTLVPTINQNNIALPITLSIHTFQFGLIPDT